MSSTPIRQLPTDDFQYTVGSGPECPLNLSAPGIRPRHCQLARLGDFFFVKALVDEAGSHRGVPLRKGCWVPVEPNDSLVLGTEFELQLTLTRRRHELRTTPLEFRDGPAGPVLCQGLFLRSRPGTMTAILGRSASGKSVFLRLLAGYLRPTAGEVWLGEVRDPYANRGRLERVLGYVPQGDLLLPELTVREALHHRLRLLHPRMERGMREAVVRRTCAGLGFGDGEALDRFLGRRVGSADTPGRESLTGGQRRRVSVALELLGMPKVLLLDEPTTGLSSVDADEVVAVLRRIATERQIVVVAVIHQPSDRALADFDEVLLVRPGGKPAYYGPRERAWEVLDGGAPAEGQSRAEALVRKADGMTEGRVVERGGDEAEGPAAGGEGGVRVEMRRGGGLVLQGRRLGAVVRRDARVLASSPAALALNLLYGFLVAWGMVLAFGGGAAEFRRENEAARVLRSFNAVLEPVQKRGGAVNPDAAMREAIAGSGTAQGLSEQAGRYRVGCQFVLVAAIVWFGIVSGSREIVREVPLLRREARCGLRSVTYLAAKGLFQALLVAWNAACALWVVHRFLAGEMEPDFLPALGALVLAGASAAALGLLVSSLSRTYAIALSLVPPIMIYQLLFGGLLRAPEAQEPGMGKLSALRMVAIQRWAFEAVLACDGGDGTNVIRQRRDTDWQSVVRGDRYSEWAAFRVETLTTRDLVFAPAPRGRAYGVGMVMLAVLGVGALGLALGRLSRAIWSVQVTRSNRLFRLF